MCIPQPFGKWLLGKISFTQKSPFFPGNVKKWDREKEIGKFNFIVKGLPYCCNQQVSKGETFTLKVYVLCFCGKLLVTTC